MLRNFLLTSLILCRVLVTMGQDPGKPEDYGAIGDGSADDTRALVTCFGKHDNIILTKTYLVTGSIPIRSNHQVYFQNATIKFVSNKENLFSSLSQSNWQFSGKGRIFGTGLTNENVAAIYIEGGRGIDISGITIERMQGTAIEIRPGKEMQRGNCLRLSNSALINCWTGIKIYEGSEYHSIANTNVIGCNSAVEIRGGNVTFTGGNIGDNKRGLYVGGRYGTNNSHGIINGVNINHNEEYNIWCDSVELGQTFMGCHVYGERDRSIIITESRAVNFVGGIIDGRIAITASNKNQYHYFNGVQLEPYFNLTPIFPRASFVNCFTRDKGYYPKNSRTGSHQR